MLDEHQLHQFKTISKFVEELQNAFGQKYKQVRLYARLLRKTGLIHDVSIAKHLQCFADFCISNRSQIASRSAQLPMRKITYSDKVFIDMEDVFELADNETRPIIWQHLLALSSLLDKESNAKTILESELGLAKNKSNTNECDFIQSLLLKVESQIKPSDIENPADAISSVMSSGLIPEIMNSMQDKMKSGELDIKRLMSTVQNLIKDTSGVSPSIGSSFSKLMDL